MTDALEAETTEVTVRTSRREAAAKIVCQALWSPVSGPVAWTPEKVAAAFEQAFRVADAILALPPDALPPDEEVVARYMAAGCAEHQGLKWGGTGAGGWTGEHWEEFLPQARRLLALGLTLARTQ